MTPTKMDTAMPQRIARASATTHLCATDSGSESSSTAPRQLRVLLALTPLALLVACGSSVPLPPWPDKTAPVATRPAPVSAQPAVGAPGAVVTPVPARPALGVPPPPAAEPAVTAPAAPPPYNEAVAARFPAPAVTYSTPGLQANRSTFSSNQEVSQWIHAVANSPSTSGTKAAIVSLGQSQQGTPLEALVLTRATGTDSTSLQASERPTVLLVGQQHGDEPAGAEALLVVARELGTGLLEPLLDRINVVIVPRANPDGSAANQRVTTSGVDMNRDHLLLGTPEAQALARLARDYRPAVVVDAHEYTAVGRFLEKFNAIQRFDALLQYTTTANTPEFITKASEEWFRRPLVAALGGQQLSSEWYYTTSTDPKDLRVSMGGTQPDTGRNVNGLRNTVSILVETRGVGLDRLHIQRRVHTQVTALNSVLKVTADRAADLNKLLSYVNREVSAQACTGQAVVEAGPTPGRFDLKMLDPVTGADRTVNVDWNSSLTLQTLKSRARPCGYWLAPTATEAVDRLRKLGVSVQRVAESGSVLGETYRETGRTEGIRKDVRGTVAGSAEIDKVDVALVRSLVDVPAGSYYVALNQPLANLALAALEPDTQNSFYANHLLDDLKGMARIMAEPTVRLEPVN